MLQRILRSVPLRILVNGTRGKSTAVKIIHLALNRSGISAVAKTTGDAPLIYQSDGRTRMVVRRAPAGIRENIWFLFRVAQEHPRAVILECNALQAENQQILARHIFRPTHILLTGAEVDHREVMGQTRAEIAATLSRCLRLQAHIYLPETEQEVFLPHISAETTEFRLCPTVPPAYRPVHFPGELIESQWGLLSALLGDLGVSSVETTRAFREVWEGIDRNIVRNFPDQQFHLINLLSVNDAPTAGKLIDHLQSLLPIRNEQVVLLNLRQDRPLRSQDFIRLVQRMFPESQVWLTGSGRHLGKRLLNSFSGKVEVLNFRETGRRLRQGFNRPTTLFALANHRDAEHFLPGTDHTE